MKCLRVLYLLALLMSVFIVALSVTSDMEEYQSETLFDDEEIDDAMQDTMSLEEDQGIASLRGVGRLLYQKAYGHQAMTCNKYPRVCRTKGSQGPDCCKKKCVNTNTDRLNCGMCGKKCKYPEICCKGKCVNPLNDRNNCGGCKKKCKKGFKCGYGICNYAY